MHIIDSTLSNPTLSLENEFYRLSYEECIAGDGVDIKRTECRNECNCCNCTNNEEISTNQISQQHSDSQCFSENITRANRRRYVGFSHVEIREYSLEIDKPAKYSFSGPAITMGWSHTVTESIPIDRFEEVFKRHHTNILTNIQRKNLLRAVGGFTEVDFRRVCGKKQVIGGKKMHRHSRSWDDLSSVSIECLGDVNSEGMTQAGLFADI